MANVINSSLESWKSADFITLLKDLDIIACEIANDKDQSDISRRLLIDKNKKFKEQVSVETRKEVASLLKSFQNEVDVLNKRNKNLETQLLTFYKKLIDLPDPCNALQLAVKNQKKVQKCHDLLLENKKLRETLEEYQLEFSGVKNQEVTIKQLRDRVKELELNMSANIDAKCKEIERELVSKFAEKERDLSKEKIDASYKQNDLEKKLALTEQKYVDSQSELFQMKNKFDEFSAAKASEMELLINENERNNERLRQLESEQHRSDDERLMLQQRFGSHSLSSTDSVTREIEELQIELNSKDNEITKLNEEIRLIHAQSTQRDKQIDLEIDHFRSKLASNDRMISNLQSQLQSRSDYDEIKKELEIIKSIEFHDFQQADVDNHSRNSSTNVPPMQSKSIEQLVNEKNRQLQNELLQIKASYTHLQMEFEKLRDEDDEKSVKLHEKIQLINQLEEDLRNVKTFLPSIRKPCADLSDESSPNSPVDYGSSSSKGIEASILADVLDLNGSDDNQTGQSSLLAIVQSQRDRFKIRSQELEMNVQLCQQNIQSLQQENEQIRADNLKLYEKVRFLQSYSRSSQSSTEDKTMSRYSSEYEANINPFQTFNRHEKHRQYQALPPHEKIVLSLGKFVMGNRTARLFAFLYSLLLHFLIFIVLYKLAYTEACVRDQAMQCRKEFAEHMKNAHGH